MVLCWRPLPNPTVASEVMPSRPSRTGPSGLMYPATATGPPLALQSLSLLLEQASQALGRPDGFASILPNLSLFNKRHVLIVCSVNTIGKIAGGLCHAFYSVQRGRRYVGPDCCVAEGSGHSAIKSSGSAISFLALAWRTLAR